MDNNGSLKLPALRCHMGSWVYYVATIPLAEVAARVRRYSEERYPKNLDYVMQRALEPRVGDIAQYLARQPDRFFNAIVVGVVGGGPRWWRVTVPSDNSFPQFDEEFGDTLGVLELTGGERMFAIDGQHRVEAIRRAVAEREEIGDEELAVIFVSHKETAEAVQKTRRMFVTLNKYAKAPGRGYEIAMDEDDAFAITTRKLMAEYDGLNRVHHVGARGEAKAIVQFQTVADLQRNNQHSLTSIMTLYDITVNVSTFPGQTKKDLQRYRSEPDVIEEFYARNVRFWDALRSSVPEIDAILQSDPATDPVEALGVRHEAGGHVLFRPAGQKAFSKAAQFVMASGSTIEDSVRQVSDIPMQLVDRPWLGTLWDSLAQKMKPQAYRLHYTLFLYMAGEHVDSPKYDLLDEYRKATGDERASLPSVTARR